MKWKSIRDNKVIRNKKLTFKYNGLFRLFVSKAHL